VVDLARPGQDITYDELQLATRNRGMPLEAMRYDITPVGMHYLLTHFDVPDLDATTWRLRIDGRVRRPLGLTLDDLLERRSVTMPVTMECAGNGRARLSPRPISQPWLNEAIGTASWTGTPLAPLLAEAGLDDAVELVFTGADRGIQGDVEQDYQRSLTVDEASRPEVLLAYAMNGRPLEPQHGYPLRLIVPGWYGMTSVKWLTRIEAVDETFQGWQQVDAYRYRTDDGQRGEPVTRIRVRALMVPPGIPHFLSRRRVVPVGPATVTGRAWCGTAPVVKVEFGVDGAWDEAKLDEPVGDFAWRRWSYDWTAPPGDHVLTCRATDAQGRQQPLEQPWNVEGCGNNLVQEVLVTVE
jgi:DMSO/TMAO reductase YedYZ molybdopterin-dependent catalytic subunit